MFNMHKEDTVFFLYDLLGARFYLWYDSSKDQLCESQGFKCLRIVKACCELRQGLLRATSP